VDVRSFAGAEGVAPGAEPLGVVLAGGAGRRFGGSGGGGGGGGGGGKASVVLGGVTLAARVAATLGAAVGEVVVGARPDTSVRGLGPSVAVWREPPGAPRHPLFGVAWALGRAGGRAVLVCAVDLPFVDVELLRRLARCDGLAVLDGQPLVGRYPAGAAPALAAAAREGRPARATVAKLDPIVIPVADPGRTLFNVNTSGDLTRAEELLRSGG
jgi:molybdopterin-guanine dinucleotide biosynthesis protein A